MKKKKIIFIDSNWKEPIYSSKYIQCLTPTEIKIKSNNEINEKVNYDDFMKRNLLTWSKNEKEILNSMIKNADLEVYNKLVNLPQYNFSSLKMSEHELPIYFAKFPDKYVWGYPHTSRQIIFLPKSFVKNISSNSTSNGSSYQTIKHEYIHILQRKYPEKFINFYQSQDFHELCGLRNGYYIYDKKLGKKLMKRYKNKLNYFGCNPDAVNNYWIWVQFENDKLKKYWLFSQSFPDHAKSFQLDLETKEIKTLNIDHPNELLAYKL